MSNASSAYLLQPDVLLPLQYYSRRIHKGTAEHNLAVAVLQDAIDCFQKNAFASDRRRERLFRETAEWIMSDDMAPFSFVHLCEALALDATYLRTGLEQWREMESGRRKH